jgi:hypothetical protein
MDRVPAGGSIPRAKPLCWRAMVSAVQMSGLGSPVVPDVCLITENEY